MEQTFYSNGKLLLTGEYLVLDGTVAMALPTKKGQSLKVASIDTPGLKWQSYDIDGICWFEADFLVLDNGLKLQEELSEKHRKTAITLLEILNVAREMNSDFLRSEKGSLVTTQLDFPRNWGLGTSSTLINNIAQWANVNAFELLDASFGGSGYDIAAAQINKPFFYEKTAEAPIIRSVALSWDFTDQLFFVHLNEKQDSKEGIARYRSQTVLQNTKERVSDLSRKLLLCYSLSDFENLVHAHEDIISEVIKMPTIKSRLFSDYMGAIKSLGAWGGDFILATGTDAPAYFRAKGYNTVVPFNEMILPK